MSTEPRGDLSVVPSAAPRITFVTDIVTPYMVAVFEALATRTQLTVIFCSLSGTRAMNWSTSKLGFQHRILRGPAIRRSTPDATDFYPDPRVLLALARSRCNVVISGGFSFPTLYAAMYCGVTKTPLLIHSDGTAASEAGIGRGQRLTRAVFARLADGAIGNSKPAARRFEELGFAPVFEAPHSSALKRFLDVGARRAYGPGERLRVVTAGRLIPRKGFDRLLHAVARARTDGANVELTIVGNGEEESRLRELASDLGLSDVEWAGFIEPHELPDVFARADVFAFPTLDDPFGIVLLEAAASGLALVASPHGGATEDLVAQRGSGIIADPNDVEAFAHALKEMTAHPSLRERAGRAAHAVASQRTPENTADAYIRAARSVAMDRSTGFVYTEGPSVARAGAMKLQRSRRDMSTISAPPTPNSRPLVRERITTSDALRRHPSLAATCVMMLALLGLGLGLHRHATYTATSQLVVEPLAPTVVQLSGAVQAAEDLATNESRLIDSDAVTRPLAQQFKTTPHHIANHLSATPVPNSTVIKINAESDSSAGAIALANSAAERFSTHVTSTLQNNTIANRVLKSYTAAALVYRRALEVQQRVASKKSSKQARLETGAAVDAAHVRQQALSQQYENLLQSHSTAPTVAPFVLASTSTSDRTSKLETYVFAGLVAGLLIGCALVTLFANRRSRRDAAD